MTGATYHPELDSGSRQNSSTDPEYPAHSSNKNYSRGFQDDNIISGQPERKIKR